MSVSIVIASLALAQGSPAIADVAYRELANGQNEAAIERIESNEALDEDNPARSINLGIALAREGEVARARTLFEDAMRSDDRVPLETATGEWADSRTLARTALRKLARGDFATDSRLASR